jgi:hypothetical protein
MSLGSVAPPLTTLFNMVVDKDLGMMGAAGDNVLLLMPGGVNNGFMLVTVVDDGCNFTAALARLISFDGRRSRSNVGEIRRIDCSA